MNPRNRKMFRPRNAGRQAAGILASSPQLMQTVQKRNIGGLIRNQILPDIAIDQTFTPRPFVGNPIGSPSFRTRPPGAPRSGRSFTPIPGAGNMMPRMGPPVSQGPTGPSFRTRPPGARTVPGGGLGSFITGSGEVNPFTGFTPIPGAGDMMPRLGPPTVAEQMTDSAVSGADTQSQVGPISRPKDIPEKKETLEPPEKKEALESPADQTGIDDAKQKIQQTTEKILDIDPQQSQINLNDEDNPITMFSLAVAEKVDAEDVNIEEISKQAKEVLGIEPGKLDKKRKDAFYFNIIKAGLAIAAGGDSNALTNIAKGLSFGINEYGKDISALNEEERENRKEFANLKYRMIKDEETANIAKAASENLWRQNTVDTINQYNQAIYNAQIAERNEEYKRLVDERNFQLDLIDKAYARAQLENSTAYQIGMLEAKNIELTLQEARNIAEQNLAFLQTQPDIVKILLRSGDLKQVGTDIEWTEQGEKNDVASTLRNYADLLATKTQGETSLDKKADSIFAMYNVDMNTAVIMASVLGKAEVDDIEDAYKTATGKDIEIDSLLRTKTKDDKDPLNIPK
tara:strand:- start:4307 stop:6019 length:1713 start_codon:yes stop_codon:yes gene_type:complete